MKYLHTMVRVSDVEESLGFYNLLGLREIRRHDNEKGRFTLVYLAAPGNQDAQLELTWNWDEKGYDGGRNFGHIAYRVDNIYETCQRLMDAGVTINRPPRDGHMAFVRQTAFRSNCCRRVASRRPNPGRRCRIREHGDGCGNRPVAGPVGQLHLSGA